MRTPPRAWTASASLVLIVLALAGCQSSSTNQFNSAPSSIAAQSRSATTHDLSQDEAAGGHTLKKHVGRSDDQLRERLQRERNISAASTYTDRETAQRAVAAAFQQNQSKIERWLNREGGHPNLVLDYDDPHPIGRTLRRGEDQAQLCSHAVIVLKWDGDNHYHVLTTYPECR